MRMAAENRLEAEDEGRHSLMSSNRQDRKWRIKLSKIL